VIVDPTVHTKKIRTVEQKRILKKAFAAYFLPSARGKLNAACCDATVHTYLRSMVHTSHVTLSALSSFHWPEGRREEQSNKPQYVHTH
jgi:hypothetical protein